MQVFWCLIETVKVYGDCILKVMEKIEDVTYGCTVNGANGESKDNGAKYYVNVTPVWELVSDNGDNSARHGDSASDPEDVEHEEEQHREQLRESGKNIALCSFVGVKVKSGSPRRSINGSMKFTGTRFDAYMRVFITLNTFNQFIFVCIELTVIGHEL